MKDTTTQGNPKFVPPAERIATFDQDGTLWVEHPVYSQIMYVLESVPALVKATKIGTFTQVLYDEATKKGWIVISMKDDWKRIFAFEQ